MQAATVPQHMHAADRAKLQCVSSCLLLSILIRKKAFLEWHERQHATARSHACILEMAAPWTCAAWTPWCPWALCWAAHWSASGQCAPACRGKRGLMCTPVCAEAALHEIGGPGEWYRTLGAHWLVGLGEVPSTSPSATTSWRVRRGAGAIALVHLAARATHTAVTGEC